MNAPSRTAQTSSHRMAEGSAKLAFAIGTKGTGKCVRRAEANVRQVRQGNIEIQIDRDVDRDPEEHLICDALQIALVATQLETAWHSGAVTAMVCLLRATYSGRGFPLVSGANGTVAAPTR